MANDRSRAAEVLAGLGLNNAGSVAFRNRVINGAFAVNQRAAPAASTAYTAGTYILDRWKAGPGGVTLAWAVAASGGVTATVTAGTLLQVIEGGLSLPEGGAFVLSWRGTATARVYQGAAAGAYTNSPITMPALAGATNTTVEFGIGTLGLVQLEPGSAATAFEWRDDELRRCRRYFRTSYDPGVAPGTANAVAAIVILIQASNAYYPLGSFAIGEPMRVKPTMKFYSSVTGAGDVMACTDGTDVSVYNAGSNANYFTPTSQNVQKSPGFSYALHWTATAEL